MRKILAIVKKELWDTFQSPIAYIVLFIALTVFNVFFFMIIDNSQEATLRDVFKIMEFMFVFFIPLLMMRSFSEEKRVGTMEFLQTMPVTNMQIVLGKFFSGVLFMTLLIFLTGIYYLIIEFFGTPDRWPILCGYAGLWLESCFFVAISLMTSSWTRSQVIAAITSFMIIFTMFFAPSFIKYVHGFPVIVLRYFSTTEQAGNFFEGLIVPSSIVFFLSGILFCLLLTKTSIENKLWR